MRNLASILNLLSVVVLGLFSGAFLFIALVVVKFWQAVEPEVFLVWMNDHFFRFPMLMVPLNMVSLLLAITAFGTAWKIRPNSRLALGLSLICIFACTITFPIYFAGANAAFLSRTIAIPDIFTAIQTWANWHWMRTTFAFMALAFASWGLLQQSFHQTEKVAAL
jgi:hypothetical protein